MECHIHQAKRYELFSPLMTLDYRPERKLTDDKFNDIQWPGPVIQGYLVRSPVGALDRNIFFTGLFLLLLQMKIKKKKRLVHGTPDKTVTLPFYHYCSRWNLIIIRETILQGGPSTQPSYELQSRFTALGYLPFLSFWQALQKIETWVPLCKSVFPFKFFVNLKICDIISLLRVRAEKVLFWIKCYEKLSACIATLTSARFQSKLAQCFEINRNLTNLLTPFYYCYWLNYRASGHNVTCVLLVEE